LLLELVFNLILAFTEIFILVIHKDFVKLLGWLIKSDLLVLFKNDWCLLSLVGLFVLMCLRISLNFQIMCEFNWPFVLVLEMNCDDDRKHTVTSIMDLKWRFVDHD
jgi:hypothetical protein